MGHLAPAPVAVDMRFVTPDIKRGDYYVFRAPITGGVKYVYPRMMGEKIFPVWWEKKHEKPSGGALEKKAAKQWGMLQAKIAAEKKKELETAYGRCVSGQYKQLYGALKDMSKNCRLCRTSVGIQQIICSHPIEDNAAKNRRILWSAVAFLGVSYLFLKRK